VSANQTAGRRRWLGNGTHGGHMNRGGQLTMMNVASEI
jgi:hypothetical protein